MATRNAGTADVWARFGDIGRFAILGASFAWPLKRRNFDGCFNSATAVLAAASTCKLLKTFVHERRPNGEDNDSFPSQHAAEVFAAGLSLRRHFDPIEGASVGAAMLVALSRLFARKHRPVDVAAGIAIGAAATFAAETWCSSRRLET